MAPDMLALILLENVVLEQVAEVLSDPGRILDEARRLAQKGFDSTRMEAIGQELKQVEERQRRLARLYLAGAVPESILNPESKELSLHRARLESERRALQPADRNAIDLEQLAATLPDAAARIRELILAASGEDMELILRALDIRVMASRDRVHIDGTVPALTSQDPGAPAQDLVTIVQTSA